MNTKTLFLQEKLTAFEKKVDDKLMKATDFSELATKSQVESLEEKVKEDLGNVKGTFIENRF